MGRPKKNEANEVPQFVPQTEETNAAMAGDIALEAFNQVHALYTSKDTALRKGSVNVPVLVNVQSKTGVLVISTADNSINGLLVEGGRRLKNSFVIPTTFVGDKEICVTLNVQDETSILRQTHFGTRMDNLIIPKGTHIANLVIL